MDEFAKVIADSILITIPIIVLVTTFILSVILFEIERRILKKIQFGQMVRDDGPETHRKKQGTPTMAGLVFVIVMLIMKFFIYGVEHIELINDKALKMIIFIILFGLIGMIDDLLKITKKNTKGLPSIIKFVLQIIIAAFGLIVCFGIDAKSQIFNFLFLIFIIVGTDNGVNFTDGIDGLCTFVTLVISIMFIILSYLKLRVEYLNLNIAVFAILVAFLIFNIHPAKMFMGDTGSLFLGAYVAFMSIAFNIHMALPIFGIIYMIEVLSVIIQVSYFKMTHGKRIFKMAPIHHHFEKCGFSENKIVMLFTFVTIIGCIITFFIVK